jgi:hypothetical protein
VSGGEIAVPGRGLRGAVEWGRGAALVRAARALGEVVAVAASS